MGRTCTKQGCFTRGCDFYANGFERALGVIVGIWQASQHLALMQVGLRRFSFWANLATERFSLNALGGKRHNRWVDFPAHSSKRRPKDDLRVNEPRIQDTSQILAGNIAAHSINSFYFTTG